MIKFVYGIASIDVDEFIYLDKHKTLKSALKPMFTDDTIGAMGLNCKYMVPLNINYHQRA